MRAKFLANAMAALAAVGAAVLYAFPPERYGFYPRCPVYSMTHLRCPGCGATRAFSELLHGHVAQAFAFNPLITALLPFVVAFAAFEYVYVMRQGRFRTFTLPRIAPIAALAAVVLFGVLRNI